jgi:hypothetical protein
MTRHISGLVMAALLVAGSVDAQTPERPPATTTTPPAEAQKRTPEPAGQAVNIKLELTITDQAGAGAPSKKVVTLIIGDRQSGMVRSKGQLWITERRAFSGTINVDARPVIVRDGIVRVELSLEYQPTPPSATAAATQPLIPGDATVVHERIGVILDSGKPIVVSEAFDPASDRKVSVELKATILK